MKPSRVTAVVVVALSACLLAHAQDAAAAAPSSSLTLWGLVKAGGWAMWPLGACSLAGCFLAFHVWRETQPEKFVPPVTGEWRDRLAGRDVAAAHAGATSSATVLGRALAAALPRAQPELPDGGRERLEGALAEALEGEDQTVQGLVNYLNVVATVAPMIGLLGTVSGMIGAFQTMSTGGMGRPERLAGDIGEALITTAAGLIIGIPAMIAYFVLRTRANQRMLVAAQTASSIVDAYAAGPAEARA